MKKSEIKRSLEAISWCLLGVKDMIDRPQEILTEHLQSLDSETENALALVHSLCDYMIDNGEVNISEELREFHDEAVKINSGEFGSVTYSDENEERDFLFNRIIINVANIWVAVQHYWEYIEDKGEQQTAMTNENNIWEDKNIFTDRAKKCYEKAITEGYMSKHENGYCWNKSLAQLAYFTEKIYADEKKLNTIPNKGLEKLFGVKNLSSVRSRLYDSKKVQVWRNIIDDLVCEATKEKEEESTLKKTALNYQQEGLTQRAIAEKLSISAAKVNRLLKKV